MGNSLQDNDLRVTVLYKEKEMNCKNCKFIDDNGLCKCKERIIDIVLSSNMDKVDIELMSLFGTDTIKNCKYWIKK